MSDPPASHRPIRSLWAVATTVICAAAGAHALFESDTWWHLGLGRAVLESGARSFPEPMAHVPEGTAAHAPEWLFEVTAWAVWKTAGAAGLVGMSAVLAGLAGLGVATLALRSGSGAAPLFIGGLAACAVLTRVRLRPEVASLILAAATLLLAQRWRCRASGLGAGAAGALVLASVLWAQVHGSFFMGTVFVLVAGVDAARWREADRRRGDGLLVCALLLTLTTGTYGVRFVESLLAHSTGFASDRVADLRGLTWAGLDPAHGPAGPAWLVLVALAAAGLFIRPLAIPDLGLVAIALALPLNAARFLALSAIVLVGPACRGAAALVALRGAGREDRAAGIPVALWAVLGAATTALGAAATWDGLGPPGPTGVLLGSNPMAGARALATGPPRVVVAGYSAGAAVGFFGWGEQHPTLDSRVPLLFDGPAFSELYLAEIDATALLNTIARTGATAIVLGRDAAACGSVPPEFTLAVVEPDWSTWVSDGSLPELEGFRPCGERWLTERACATGAAELTSLAGFSDPTFLAWGRARLALDCDGDAAAALAALPDVGLAGLHAPQVRIARAEALQRLGRWEEAAGAAEEDLRSGDLTALSALAVSLRSLPPERACDLLHAAAGVLRGATPRDLAADAAVACLAAGRTEAGAEHALAAAAAGSPRVSPALLWLAEHGDTPRLRSQARTWLELRTTAPPPDRGSVPSPM
ncbi:MAG: hypothetical protein EXR69_02310 [Myxococcales bacterium]|nr:hypothetical protein [Myxococcales bacterium]